MIRRQSFLLSAPKIFANCKLPIAAIKSSPDDLKKRVKKVTLQWDTLDINVKFFLLWRIVYTVADFFLISLLCSGPIK